MRRREFITLIGGAAVAWPLAARSQQTKVHRVGALFLGTADAESFQKELRKALGGLGYIEGQNLAFEFRSAEGKPSVLPALAAELVRLKVDVIVALFTPCALAAKQATQDIPIVILSGDPIGTGLVSSLSRPGGNITGLSQMAAETHGKCVELFRDMMPSIRRVAVLGNTTDPFTKPMLNQIQLAGGTARIEIQPVVMVRAADQIDEIDTAFASMARAGAEAVVVQGGFSTRPVAELAIKHRLPAATTPRAFVDVGGLMSFGYDGPDLFRRSAIFVHKVLQGQRPSDIPVEQPVKFELVVNLKTAKALGLTIPGSFLLRADDVIE